jgi:hypothetical protein
MKKYSFAGEKVPEWWVMEWWETDSLRLGGAG